MKQMLLKARNGLVASAMVGLLMAGWSVSASDQTCTTTNWSSSVGLEDGVSDATGNVGTPPSFRRYAGPCGLRVPMDGTPRYLVDESPIAETSYIARFYVFLGAAASETVTLFEALDAANNPRLRVTYTASDITLDVFSNGADQTIEFTELTNGWHSVELSWSQAAAAEVSFSLNGGTPSVVTVDTSGLSIDEARLGNINGATLAQTTAIDFDDFDSRRSTFPGRLCRGLTNESRSSLDFDDVLAIFGEVASGGGNAAGGQPDFDENGEIDFDDVLGVFGRIAAGNDACAVNS